MTSKQYLIKLNEARSLLYVNDFLTDKQDEQVRRKIEKQAAKNLSLKAARANRDK